MNQEVCRYGVNCLRHDCKYKHEPVAHKNIPCIHFQSKGCLKGDHCPYKHIPKPNQKSLSTINSDKPQDSFLSPVPVIPLEVQFPSKRKHSIEINEVFTEDISEILENYEEEKTMKKLKKSPGSNQDENNVIRANKLFEESNFGILYNKKQDHVINTDHIHLKPTLETHKADLIEEEKKLQGKNSETQNIEIDKKEIAVVDHKNNFDTIVSDDQNFSDLLITKSEIIPNNELISFSENKELSVNSSTENNQILNSPTPSVVIFIPNNENIITESIIDSNTINLPISSPIISSNASPVISFNTPAEVQKIQTDKPPTQSAEIPEILFSTANEVQNIFPDKLLNTEVATKISSNADNIISFGTPSETQDMNIDRSHSQNTEITHKETTSQKIERDGSIHSPKESDIKIFEKEDKTPTNKNIIEDTKILEIEDKSSNIPNKPNIIELKTFTDIRKQSIDTQIKKKEETNTKIIIPGPKNIQSDKIVNTQIPKSKLVTDKQIKSQDTSEKVVNIAAPKKNLNSDKVTRILTLEEIKAKKNLEAKKKEEKKDTSLPEISAPETKTIKSPEYPSDDHRNKQPAIKIPNSPDPHLKPTEVVNLNPINSPNTLKLPNKRPQVDETPPINKLAKNSEKTEKILLKAEEWEPYQKILLSLDFSQENLSPQEIQEHKDIAIKISNVQGISELIRELEQKLSKYPDPPLDPEFEALTLYQKIDRLYEDTLLNKIFN
jgi:hypothetical protein